VKIVYDATPLLMRSAGVKNYHYELLKRLLPAIAPHTLELFPRLDSLADWVLNLDPPAPIRADDEPAVLRGKKLFESSEVACATCHSGKKLTNNETVDVGTSNGEPLQVPSLLGVGHRSPLIHNGCAQTLAERFDPECGGGDKHGKTSQLSPAELDDLIAYLDSL